MNNRPVIVFDSGLGGISVLRRLLALMPDERYIYFGDSVNAPYGPRPADEVRRLTLNALTPLMAQSPKAIVLACNTATALARDSVCAAFPNIPVIGIDPAVLPASQDRRNKRILVLATKGALCSEHYSALTAQIHGCQVFSVPTPGIVEYVESEMRHRDELLSYLKNLLEPYRRSPVDCVVLGCTHFPFAKDVIRDALGYEVRFYDGSDITAVRTRDVLTAQNALGDGGSIQITLSKDSPSLLGLARTLLYQQEEI